MTSKCLANWAFKMSRQKEYMSPFAKGSIAAHDKQMGGKEDDISVIVAQVIAS